MKVINITVGSAMKSFSIGRRGENEATQIVFDVSALVSQYGDGTCVLMAKRPSDTNAYPVTVTRDGNAVTWLVSEVDTQYRGTGEAELFWYVGDTLAKSIVYTTQIGRDIGQASETPPDPYETWLDTLTETAAEVTEAMREFTGLSAEAETLPAGSEATASYEDGVLSLGIPQGPKGDTGDAGADAVTYVIEPSANAIVYDPNAPANARLNPSTITLNAYRIVNGEKEAFTADELGIALTDGDDHWYLDYTLDTATATCRIPASWDEVGGVVVTVDPSIVVMARMAAFGDNWFARLTIPIIAAGTNGQDGATGPQGPQGETGAVGATGPAGPGVPSGGTEGQFLVKQSTTDYDAAWVTLQTWQGGNY